MRAKLRKTPNLSLPGGHTIAWWGIRGLGWEDFIHSAQVPVLFRTPPKVILIHLGGNDITKHSLRFIFKMLQESLEYITSAFPDCKFVWIDILQRLNWGVGNDEKRSVEKKRKRVNQFGHKQIRKTNDYQILCMDINEKTPGFFRNDAVHLSDVGLDMYNDAIRDILLKILKV